MNKPGHALRLVTAATQGYLPDEADWPIVLDIANRGWLCPAIWVALRRVDRLNDVPLPVRDYLFFLHNQNYERNRRFRGQLLEATSALNGAGIVPILLKGAIHLFTAGADVLGARMMSDLDIHIDPLERGRATSVLIDLGYCCSQDAPELARPQDVGVIELHDRPNSRSARYLSGDLGVSSLKEERDGAIALIPDATARALHLIVHDMIKEGDHWSFRIDLRHLHDLAHLARSGEGIDWRRLGAVLSDDMAHKALVGQASALEDLFSVQITADLHAGRLARLRHLARLVCASPGPSASAVRLAGNVSRTVHQISQGYAWRGAGTFSRQVFDRFASRNRGSRV